MTRHQLVDQIFQKRTYLCVGLDTDIDRIPRHLRDQPDAVLQFNRQIIEATKDHCVAYKINTAFYEASGAKGWDVMAQTAALIPDTHLRIADAKRGDIGNTSAQYARAFFETLAFDAVTVAPYMGADSVRPFLEYTDKWTILLGLTSNAGAADFEMQRVLHRSTAGIESAELALDVSTSSTEHLYETVLRTAAGWGSEENLMFVIGATQADSFSTVRRLTPNHFYLVPGVGAQGGSLRDISKAALTADCGLLVNASRAIIYASEGEDFADEAAAIASQYAFEMAGYLPGSPVV
ncbi:MAG: orotidine 5-phosphate decarboxylase [Flaviaesturariibacter sp.]|nr:orotidine 5-phosphate decarboxylase [Flaviaesturariibacter sp.]